MRQFDYKKLAYDQMLGRHTEDGHLQEAPVTVNEGAPWQARWEQAFWERLQELGKDGWEIVTVEYTEGAPKGFVLLKREVDTGPRNRGVPNFR